MERAERFLHDQASRTDIPQQSSLAWAHADLDPFGITLSSARDKKLSWPRRNVTGNHSAVEISD